jgi:hypothetical protein
MPPVKKFNIQKEFFLHMQQQRDTGSILLCSSSEETISLIMATAARYISQQSPARRQRQCRRAAALLKMILGMSLLFMAVPCWAYGFNNNSPLLIPKAAITSRRIHAAHVTATSSAFSSWLFRSSSSTNASSRTQQSRRGTQPLRMPLLRSPPLWMTSLSDADGEKKNLEEEAATTSIVGNKAEAAAAGDAAAAAAVGGGSSDKDDNFESGGVLRTIFLAGPLFVKFAIVLM